MDLNPVFQDFFLTLKEIYATVELVEAATFNVVLVNDKIYLHLVPLDNVYSPQKLIDLQSIYAQRSLMLLHLWEDVWIKSKPQVLSRIDSFCGLNKRMHARKAKILNLEADETSSFLNANHLQGYIKTKFNYGLAIDDNLVAAASFSGAISMKTRGENYKSAELIRFATLSGCTVVGGLSKLVKHFLTHVDINDLMTYADRDWSLGKGYNQLGFQYSGISQPVFFYLDTHTFTRYQAHRLPKQIQLAYNNQSSLTLEEFLQENGFVKLFNTGNLKYHLYI